MVSEGPIQHLNRYRLMRYHKSVFAKKKNWLIGSWDELQTFLNSFQVPGTCNLIGPHFPAMSYHLDFCKSYPKCVMIIFMNFEIIAKNPPSILSRIYYWVLGTSKFESPYALTSTEQVSSFQNGGEHKWRSVKGGL